MTSYRQIKDETAEFVEMRIVRKANTEKAHAAIRDVIIANPNLTYQEIAVLLGCSHWLVYKTAVEFGIRRARGAGSPARRKESNEIKGK